jgi:hypothetical protein
VALELLGQLLRRVVRARPRYGVRPSRALVSMTVQCSADPCEFADDGTCDVPKYCTKGDYIDCATAGNPVINGINGSLPLEIGMLSCRSKITDVYAAVPPAARRLPPSAAPAARGPLLQGLRRLPLGRLAARNHLCADRRLTHVRVSALEVPLEPPARTL